MTNPPRGEFRPLSRRLIRSILAGAALCAVVIGGAVSAWTYQRAERNFGQALADIGRANVPMLSVGVWDIEPEAIRRQLDAIAARPEIGGVRLRVKTGQHFEAGSLHLLASGTPRRFVVPAPTNADVAIADLDIVADPAARRHEVLQEVGAAMTGVTLLTLVVCGLIVAILRRDLERPLRHIARFTRELSPATLTRPLRVDRPERSDHDEIDLVVAAFSALQDGIRGHIESLDSQVAARTRELQDALEAIRRLSSLDALTGCFNRALFNERAPQEVQRAERYGRPLSLVFVDIDRFKRINDTLGHLAGDAVLRATAERCCHGLREQVDWVTRLGGEEFVLVLPETSLEDALRLAERLRHRLHAPIALDDGRHIAVTASFGVAERGPGESMEQLLGRADALLYAAKAAGRDCVMPRVPGAGVDADRAPDPAPSPTPA